MPAHPHRAETRQSDSIRLRLLGFVAAAVLVSCGVPVGWQVPDCRAIVGDAPIGAEAGACGVTLAPGGSLALPLPAGRSLTLSADRALDPADLTIALSEGTGILLATDLPVTNGAIGLPLADDDQVVHLSRPTTAPDTIRLTLTWSAAERPPGLSRRFVPIEGPQVAMGLPGGETDPFTLVDARAGADFRIEGPIVLAVRTRPLYTGLSDWLRTYRIGITLDGRDHGVLEYDAAPDVDAASTAIPSTGFGFRQTEYLTVPAGAHVIGLDPSQDILVQVARSSRPATPALPSGWRLRADDLEADTCATPDRLERLGRRLSRDQARIGGTLASVAGLRDLAEIREMDTGLASQAARFESAFSFFRDVLPVSPAGLRLQVAYTDLQRTAPGPAPAQPTGAGLSTNLLLGRLTRAFLSPATGGAQPLLFVPPPRDYPSEIRVIADRTALSARVEVFLSYDGGPPQRLVVLPAAERDGTPRPSPAALGLARLPGATVEARFAAALPLLPDGAEAPVRLIEGGAMRLALPRHVRRVTLWAAPGAEGLPVAVQYRAAPSGGLGTADYLAELHELGREPARALFHGAVDAALGCPGWLTDPRGCSVVRDLLATAPVSAEELYNDWLPLLRLLRSRERPLFSSLPPENRIGPSASPRLTPAEAAVLLKAARTSTKSAVGALERLGVVIFAGAPGDWAEAQIATAGILVAEGEIFFAERLLKNFYLTAPDDAVRQRAHDALAEILRLQGATGDLVGLEAAEFRRSASQHTLVHLVDALIADGQPAMAASVALLMPAQERDRFSGLLAETGYLLDPRPVLPNTGAVWQSGEATVIQSAGGYSYVATARGSYGRFHAARPGVPLHLRVEGPALVRLRGRPFHPPGAEVALDGWFSVHLGKRLWHVPYFGNRPAAGLVTYGTPDKAGRIVEHVVAVPAGPQLILIEPQTAIVGFDIDIAPVGAKPGPWSAAAERMAALLYRFETAPSARVALLAEAGELAHRNSGDRDVAALWRGFDRRSGWLRLTTVLESAGTRNVRFPHLPAETPDLAIRQALLPPLAEGSRLVGASGITFPVTNPEPATFEARLSMLTLPTMPRRGASVSYRLDEGEPVEVALDAATPEQVVHIPVPAGPHKISFELGERTESSFVSLQLQDGTGMRLDASRRRGYDIATHEKPLVLAVEGPAWLRIDEYRDGETLSRYRALPEAARTVTLSPEPGQEEALFRVFLLRPRDAASPSRLPPPDQAERVPSAGPLLASVTTCSAPAAPTSE